MIVPAWLWIATIGGLLALVIFDVAIGHRPHDVTTGQATRWVIFYVACAVAFGVGVGVFAGHGQAVDFFTGYITEYSLSVDNLFIFMLILTSFKVPSTLHHRVLLRGIVLALIMRGAFIAIGAALIAQFVWVFFVFGAILLWTAINMIRNDEDEEYKENAVVRRMRKIFPMTDEYAGVRMIVKQSGKRTMTPMAVVIVAIGSADLLFAVDSIPAIFGITQVGYLVFTANAFALLGLRQLYFLIGGLLDRLVYLSIGLAIILTFIGAKLVLDALHAYHWVPDWAEINNWMSLGVIVVVLTITAVASLIKTSRDAQTGT